MKNQSIRKESTKQEEKRKSTKMQGDDSNGLLIYLHKHNKKATQMTLKGRNPITMFSIN